MELLEKYRKLYSETNDSEVRNRLIEEYMEESGNNERYFFDETYTHDNILTGVAWIIVPIIIVISFLVYGGVI